MHHTTAELWRRAGEGTSQFFAGLPGADLRQAPEGFLMITGEPLPDLNGGLVDEGPGDSKLLSEYVGAIRDRGLDGFLWLTGAVAPRLEPLAQSLGLTRAGESPLMKFTPVEVPPPSREYTVQPVKDQPGIDRFTDLMSRGYGMPLDTWCRLVTLESLGSAPVRHLVASVGNDAFSAGTTIRTGASVGIWNMATPPEHQRKGAGRAVLHQAIRMHLLEGTNVFYLIASEAGRHLYEQVGFRTVDEAALWLIGAATSGS